MRPETSPKPSFGQGNRRKFRSNTARNFQMSHTNVQNKPILRRKVARDYERMRPGKSILSSSFLVC